VLFQGFFLPVLNNSISTVTLSALPTKVGGLTSVLVLAGIELIFFIEASMGLCFGFVPRTVWII